MDKKKWFRSKRAWGIIIACLGKILPIFVPESQQYVDYLPEIGALVFGIGALDAKKPVGF